MTTATATATQHKDARMELKTNGETKDLLMKAAVMSGMDTSAFVLGAAVERARDVVDDHSAIRLSMAGQRRFADLMANPPSTPTDAMKRLAALPDLPERRG